MVVAWTCLYASCGFSLLGSHTASALLSVNLEVYPAACLKTFLLSIVVVVAARPQRSGSDSDATRLMQHDI